MWEAARDQVRRRGGAVHLDRRVVRVEHDGSAVTAFVARDAQGRRTRYLGQHFLSTMPIRELIRSPQGIGSVLGLAKDAVLERQARDWIERAARQFRRTGQPHRLFGSFSDAASSWDRRRRGSVKAEHTAQGANPRFVVVNVPGDPQELDDAVSCQRGEREDRTQEPQLGLFADGTSCPALLANQFRWLLSSAADGLMNALRHEALSGTELARARVGTLRLKLLQVAARVMVSVRRVVFHLTSSYPDQELYRAVLARVMGLPQMAVGSGGSGGHPGVRGPSSVGVRGELRAGGPAARAAGLGCGDACL
jgi:hypothetical protein